LPFFRIPNQKKNCEKENIVTDKQKEVEKERKPEEIKEIKGGEEEDENDDHEGEEQEEEEEEEEEESDGEEEEEAMPLPGEGGAIVIEEACQTDEIMKRFRKHPWKRMVQYRLKSLLKQREGIESDDDMLETMTYIDTFWASLGSLTGAGTLADRRYGYWKDFSFHENQALGSLGILLMSAASSEACCERGFSVLRKIFTRQRQRLSIRRVNDLVTIRDFSDP
jgi:hypothetical protein